MGYGARNALSLQKEFWDILAMELSKVCVDFFSPFFLAARII